MKWPLYFFVFLFLGKVQAQTSTQVVRGIVLEKESKKALAGVVVSLVGQTDSLVVLTDSLGEFSLPAVRIGRYNLYCNLKGYLPFARPDILVGSGKQVVMQIELDEDVVVLREALIVQKKSDPAKTNNDLVLVSGRQFTTDQTNRYAGSLLDPSRMAGNFAGVSGTTGQRNDIVIRGNSPMGLLWRLDGIDIPNPNHFSSQGTTGGPVSILNNNNLANSDFITSAFPAEYGNALSGVFDLKMRDGNNSKREYTGQIGFNGFEFGAEGPVSKKARSSYMLNYRYSTLGVFDALGINLTFAGIPYYQDLCFKVAFPNTKTGSWSITGVGGKSHIDLLASKSDSTTLNFGSAARNNIKNGSSMGAFIVGNSYRIKKGYIKTSVALTHDGRFTQYDTLDKNDNPTTTYGEGASIQKVILHTFINRKLNVSNTLRTGIILSNVNARVQDSSMDDSGRIRELRNISGQSNFAQAYAELKHVFAGRLVMNGGVYGQYFFANKDAAIEPRFGMRYALRKNQSVGVGMGLHSQMQPLEVYYGKTYIPATHAYELSNIDLKFSRALHYVLGYDNQLRKDLRLKTEIYYQQLYHIPVSRTFDTYSVLNLGGSFGGIFVVDSLENKGKGTNYGLEITIEKFFSKNYYFLVTTSLFDSKYTAITGKTYNTAFNGKYVVNLLGGYEKTLGARKRSTLGLNLKWTAAGGRRYTPIDVEKTMQSGFVEYDWSKAYAEQFKDYFRMDLKISYRFNGRKVTQEWALDIQNLLDTQNPLNLAFDKQTAKVYYEYQQGRLPMLFYRIQF